jgi:hypothetical protein
LAALRSWLRANARFSIVTGAATGLAASPIGRALDWDHPLVVRLVGVGLIGFGASLLPLARAEPARVVRGASVVVVADLGWVVGTAMVVAPPVVTTGGRLLLAAIAAIVGVFAVGQWRSLAAARRKMRRTQ